MYEISDDDFDIEYRREGDGRALYIFNGPFDYDACKQLIEHVYTEERKGEEGCSEYDPSVITTEKYELEDETDLKKILEIKDVTNLSEEENKKLFEFFEHLLWENIILIYVDVIKKTIRQIYEDDAEEGFIENQTEIVLFAREYDHVEDY